MASAAPTRRNISGYSYTATQVSYGCSPGGCAWSFSLSGPDNGATAPAFNPTYCSGTGYQTDFVACAAINGTDEYGVTGQLLSAWLEYNGTTGGEILHAKYEVTTSEGGRYDWYADKEFLPGGRGNPPIAELDVPVTKAAAVL